MALTSLTRFASTENCRVPRAFPVRRKRRVLSTEREGAEAKNQAESLVHSTEQQLNEHGDKIDDATKSDIEAKIAETKTAIEGGDSEAMKTS